MIDERLGVKFATMVVGSLPRPQWVRDLIEDRKAGLVSEAEADRLLDDAVPSAVHMQERAGLDFVSDGEWRRESYVKVFADSVGGFAPDLIEIEAPRGSGLAYPAVVSKLEPRRPIAADEARFLRPRTGRKVIVAVPSPYTIGRRMWSPAHSKRAYPTSEEFMEACIPIVREEIRELERLGVDAVQIDEPWLALLVDPAYREREGSRTWTGNSSSPSGASTRPCGASRTCTSRSICATPTTTESTPHRGRTTSSWAPSAT